MGPSSAAALAEEVEVRNSMGVPVNVKAIRNTGGTFVIGTVRASSTERLVVPERNVSMLFAVTDDGRTVGSSYGGGPAPVRIRRIAPGGTE